MHLNETRLKRVMLRPNILPVYALYKVDEAAFVLWIKFQPNKSGGESL